MIALFAVNMPESVNLPLLKILHSGYIGQGPKVDEFEAVLSRYFGKRNCLTVNSGTSALDLALRLAHVGPGDEVITTPVTCTATNIPILNRGAKVVWADVDPTTGLIDPLDVERKVTSKTKAIMCVDWGGTPCDLDVLMRIGALHGIKVIEDAAHAFGATYKGQKVGTLADFTCFSFQAIKHITTVDGGLLITKNTQDYRVGKLLRWYGIDRETDRQDQRCEEDIAETGGSKFHMNDVSATIGIEQMKVVDEIVNNHRDNAAYYRSRLKLPTYAADPRYYPYGFNSAFWLFTIHVGGRADFIRRMKDSGVMVSQVHSRNDTHSIFAPFKANLPGVEKFMETQVSIPVHNHLKPDDREYIMECIDAYYRHS